jgi:hypothetical protein
MNAGQPILDLAECARFAAFWCEVTGAQHITLTAITPDGPTTTATFTIADVDKAAAWIAREQGACRNVYFEVNETPAGCTKKPTKELMQAALCRHADIDPDDASYPYQEERDRLHRLADFLGADPLMPPTVILDSGNGIQPLWVVTREALTPETVERIEAENRSIEAAVGAAGTHNIDRLLRLPGTLNFPNATKKAHGRAVSRARLLHSAPVAYSPAEAARLGKRLAERLAVTDLVHPVAKATGRGHAGRDRSRIAMGKGAALRRAGKSFAEMCTALRSDPETADWCREKGDANGGRELHRIWDKAGEAADTIDRTIAEFNARYMVVSEAGKAVIYAPAEDPILHRRYFDRLGFDDLRRLYLNRRIEVGRDDNGNPIMRPVADVWLHHAERRQFIRGVAFDPSGCSTPDGTLNLWQGFAVKPSPGQWDLLKLHIFEIICGSCRDRFDYLMNWLARMAQHPAEQGEVAIVMRGGEGTGKGTLARAMTRILGQHGLAISNSKHLTGNFNAHLRDCVFLFADEAFYAGDPSHVGVLKSIITEPYLTIEAKYQNAVQMPNFLHLMMASNEEWVVPAALDARRFFVLEVSRAHANDHDWFGAIWREMEAGGYAAMLYDLLHHDLTGFNVRHVPDTDGLQEQKKLSLGTSEAWWLDVLHRGYVYRSKLGLEAFFGEWHAAMTTEVLFASYGDFAKSRSERHPMNREGFGKFIARMGAKPVKPRDAVIGERIADVAISQYGDTTRKAELVKQPRAHGYSLGDLAQARHAFGAATGLSPAWPDDGPDEGTEE